MSIDTRVQPTVADRWRTARSRLTLEREDISDAAFQLRLRLCLSALAITAVIVATVGLINGEGLVHILTEMAPTSIFFIVARRTPHRIIAMFAVSFGLATNSAILVHYTDGLIESHLSFFVVLPLIALFQDWRATMSAAGLVLAHHGIIGMIDPTAVYNHTAAQENPLLWGAIHGAFLLALVFTLMVLWHFSTQDHRTTREALDALTSVQDELEHRAFHDPLTNLGNRALLIEELEIALANDNPVNLYVIDIDRFQLVNESLGHDLGDQLLLAVAERLQQSIRTSDLLVHVGADEFVVMTRTRTDSNDLESTGQRFRSAFTRPMVIDHESFPMSVSVGAAASHRPAQVTITDPSVLLRNADAAMNQAKSAGRNSVALFDEEIRSLATHRLELRKELHQAVADEAFELHYQPVIDMKNGRMIGVEALVRWNHPTRGMVNPDDFIPVAEDTGVIIPIGEWVLWEACIQVLRWERRHGVRLDVAINLSARQLVSPSLLATVSDMLDTTGIDPSRICFEVTESALIDNPELAIGNLQALRDLGLDLALDDFGTQYASLTYLRTLPVNLLKIDRSFTAGLGLDPKDDTIIESTISLAHGLGLEVVAEGIEETAQYEMLESFSCDYGQGYLLGRPMPADDVIALFATSPD